MKTISKFLAASALALTMGVSSAQAAVFIGVSTDGGATISQVFADLDDGVYVWAGANLGGFSAITVDGDAGAVPKLLHSATVSANASGAANLSIFVTRTDIVAPSLHGIYSGFTGNTSGGSNFTVTLSTYLDTSNGLWGGALLESVTYNGNGVKANEFITSGLDLSNSFSVTHRYDLSTTGTSGFSTSPTITMDAVPEPTTWALMIVGFGGAGAMLRRRRTAFA